MYEDYAVREECGKCLEKKTTLNGWFIFMADFTIRPDKHIFMIH